MGKAVLFWLAAGMAAAQSVTLTVNTNGSLHTIDEKIYGQFLEHIYHSVNGGVWGEVVWNRSFEESLAEGLWKVSSGVLEAAGDGRFRFGAETWRDYEVSLDVARPTSAGVLSIGVRSNRGANYALSMGGPRGYELSRTALSPATRNAESVVLQTAAGQLENARWYNLRLRVEGQRLQVWLDGRVLFDVSAGGVPANGQAFVSARGGSGNFAHLAVKSLAGSALMSGMPTAARHWSAVGAGELSLDTEAPLNSKQSLRIATRAADSGVEQAGFAVRAGDALRGSLWASGTGTGMVVRLLDGAKVLAEQTIGAPGAEWKQFPLLLTPSAASGNATLRILARARSNVKLDQVSLMPDSSRANGGFRPDLTQAVAALRPPVIRWPGGSFVNNYRWKDGIGPQAKRTGKNGWDEWDPLAFGIDEFLAFTRKLNAEPVIVAWVGPRTPVDRAEYLRDVLDLIEYCNGSPDTTWGKIRAQNGHPQPYRVKYWELDNEVWSMAPAEYAGVLAQFVPAMRQADPGIRTIAAGSGQLGERWGDGDLAVIRNAAQYVDYLSIHHYENPDRFAEGPAAAAKFWQTLEAEIAKSKNPRMKLFVSEWNAQSTDWRTGLYAAGILNAMERDPAVTMATPALFLRHVSAPAWDNALINFDQKSWFPAPNYTVMKLFREHYAPEMLSITGSAGELNASATRSADGDRIFVKVVNPSAHEVALDIVLRGDFPLLAAGMKMVAPDSLDASNSLERPAAVQVVDGKIERAGMKARVTLPRWSVAVVTLTR
ncbi:MAG: alpha-L-arabinofuranosidase C-terminal domain-containing protein [Candidatus Solibacter sp.]